MTNDNFLYYCKSGNTMSVKKGLQDSEVDPAFNENISFLAAVYNCNLNIVKLLISDSRVNIRDRHDKAMYYACMQGNKLIVDLLLDYDLNINDRYEHRSSPIELVLTYKHFDILMLMLTRNKINLDKYFSDIFNEVLHEKNEKILMFLIEHYEDRFLDKLTLFQRLITTYNNIVLKKAIDHFSDFDFSINDNMLLRLASSYSNIFAIEMLLDVNSVFKNIFKLPLSHFNYLIQYLERRLKMTGTELLLLYSCV